MRKMKLSTKVVIAALAVILIGGLCFGVYDDTTHDNDPMEVYNGPGKTVDYNDYVGLWSTYDTESQPLQIDITEVDEGLQEGQFVVRCDFYWFKTYNPEIRAVSGYGEPCVEFTVGSNNEGISGYMIFEDIGVKIIEVDVETSDIEGIDEGSQYILTKTAPDDDEIIDEDQNVSEQGAALIPPESINLMSTGDYTPSLQYIDMDDTGLTAKIIWGDEIYTSNQIHMASNSSGEWSCNSAKGYWFNFIDTSGYVEIIVEYSQYDGILPTGIYWYKLADVEED